MELYNCTESELLQELERRSELTPSDKKEKFSLIVGVFTVERDEVFVEKLKIVKRPEDLGFFGNLALRAARFNGQRPYYLFYFKSSSPESALDLFKRMINEKNPEFIKLIYSDSVKLERI